MDNSFLSKEELYNLGFSKIGKNVLISRYARFYGTKNMIIGNYVRIDDFCILSGNILLGNNIHISAYCALYGANGIEMGDFSGLSSRTTIFSAIDDFSGDYLIGPMVKSQFRNVKRGKVIISKFVQIGANCVVFPDVIIGEGSTVGALSLVNKSLEPWGVYVGIPAKYIKERSKNLLKLYKNFLLGK